MVIPEGTTHYNDWPNAQGFDSPYEERTPVELTVTGSIPDYAAGTLYRTGTGVSRIESTAGPVYQTNHWFDNLAIIHRFQILSPDSEHPSVRVVYNSRSTCDGLIEQIQKTGRRDGITFAAKYDPCMSLFKKLQSIFWPAKRTPDKHNSAVTLSMDFPGITAEGKPLKSKDVKASNRNLTNKTDASNFQTLDPETLEPIGIASQRVLHPLLKGPLSGSHAKSDPKTGDVFNYNLELGGAKGTYRVFRVSAATGNTSILATIQGDGAYLHSIFLSEHYVLLCVWNSFYTYGGAPILWKQNVLDVMADYNPSKPAKWYVVDRTPPEDGGKGLVATYESEPFFAFHTVNAYEESSAKSEGQVDIVADLVGYDSLDILKRFYLENLVSNKPNASDWATRESTFHGLRRFRLPAISKRPSQNIQKVENVFRIDHTISPELPTLSPSVFTKKHRYIYGLTGTGKSSFLDGLVKYDTETGEAESWIKTGHTPGEAIFVADPESREEDGGVLLTVVLDGYEGKSYLLVLDAKNLSELGRAHVDGVIGFGFHGTHVPVVGRALHL